MRGLAEGRGSTIRTSPVSDFYRRKGHEAYAFVDLGSHLELGASYRRDTYGSLEATSKGRLFASDDPTPNPEIDEGVMGSVIFSAAWQARSELFGKPPIRRRHGLLRRSLFGTYWERPSDPAGRGDARVRVARSRRQLRLPQTHRRAARPPLTGEPQNRRPHPRRGVGWRASEAEAVRRRRCRNAAADTPSNTSAASASLSAPSSGASRAVAPRASSSSMISGRHGRTTATRAGKSGVGLGVQFPPRDILHIRFDLAYALNEFSVDGEVGERELRPILKIRLPF